MATREITDIISERQLEALERLDVLKETAVRNLRIRQAYRELRNQGVKAERAKRLLTEYYHLSFDQVESIIYKQRGTP